MIAEGTYDIGIRALECVAFAGAVCAGALLRVLL